MTEGERATSRLYNVARGQPKPSPPQWGRWHRLQPMTDEVLSGSNPCRVTREDTRYAASLSLCFLSFMFPLLSQREKEAKSAVGGIAQNRVPSGDFAVGERFKQCWIENSACYVHAPLWTPPRSPHLARRDADVPTWPSRGRYRAPTWECPSSSAGVRSSFVCCVTGSCVAGCRQFSLGVGWVWGRCPHRPTLPLLLQGKKPKGSPSGRAVIERSEMTERAVFALPLLLQGKNPKAPSGRELSSDRREDD